MADSLELVKIGVASELLGIKVHTLRRWAKRGAIRYYQAFDGANFMFSIDDLADFKVNKMNKQGV